MSQIILLERVDNLGEIGDVVTVKPGFARNYLLPQGKALRATKDNIAYFETQKKAIVEDNAKQKKEAEALGKKVDGTQVDIIRQASEAGQLYGSVSSRDIADALNEKGKFDLNRSQVTMLQNYKMIGLFEVPVVLHPEVKVSVTINIARSPEEAATQAKTGRALIAGAEDDAMDIKEEQGEKVAERTDDMKSELLEDSALKAEEEAKRLAEEEAAKAKAKADKKAAAEAEAKAEEAEIEEASAEAEEKSEDA